MILDRKPDHPGRRYFADRLQALFNAAGEPKHDRVAAAANQQAPRMGRSWRVDARRFGEWIAGDAVPQSFEPLWAVVEELRDQAARAGVRVRVDRAEWTALWRGARNSPKTPASTPKNRAISRTEFMNLYPVGETSFITPRQLPRQVEPFIGRSAELTALDDMLRRLANRSRIALITGMPSVGKTGLAIHWAHNRLDDFPDGQFFVDLNGFGVGRPLDPSQVLRDFLLAAGLPATRLPRGLDGRAGLFRSVTSGRRCLLVLDNAASYEHVRALIPASASCLTLVTSRRRLTALRANDGATSVPLAPLDDVASRQLLGAMAEFTNEDEPAVRRLVARARGLPLALRTYGAVVARRSSSDLAQVIDDLSREHPLDSLEPEDGDISGARQSFDWSYRALPPSTGFALRLVALHPGPEFGVGAARALTGGGESDTRRTLDGLLAASLLNVSRPGRFRLHDLLRDFAEERARSEMAVDAVDTAEYRLLAWYLHSADAADTLIASQRRRFSLEAIPRPAETLSFSTRNDALAWCDQELSNLGDAAERAVDRNYDAIVWLLPAVLWNYFYLRKPFEEWEHLNQLGLGAAERLGDTDAAAFMCNGIASSLRHQHRFADAVPYCRRALDYSKHSEDYWSLSWLHNNLAETLRGLGHSEEAFVEYQRALEINETVGDTWSRGCFLTNIGEAYSAIGQHQEAVASLQAALPLRRAHDHIYGEGWTHNDLGEAYQGLGRLDEALREYNTALALRERVNDQYGRAWTLRNIGEVLAVRADTEGARQAFDEALKLSRATDDRWGVARSADRLADHLYRASRRADARALWEEALVVFREVEPGRAALIEERLASLR